MLNKEEAKKIAEAYLNDDNPIAFQDSTGPLVIVDDYTIEKEYGWIFHYDAFNYLQTGDDKYLIAGNGPLLVLKSDGTIVSLGSAQPVEESLEEYEKGLGL